MILKLTLERGQAVYVNMDNVLSYVETGGTTYLKMVKGPEVRVRESAEDIYKEMSYWEVRGTKG